MIYKRSDGKILMRLDKGEEICESLMRIAEDENIRGAAVSGIGAADEIETGVYNLAENKYDKFVFTGNHEITSLSGTLSRKDAQPYQHLHINLADKSGNIVGGHLFRAIISLTCEIVIDIIDIEAERRFNPEIGINQLVL